MPNDRTPSTEAGGLECWDTSREFCQHDLVHACSRISLASSLRLYGGHENCECAVLQV